MTLFTSIVYQEASGRRWIIKSLEYFVLTKTRFWVREGIIITLTTRTKYRLVSGFYWDFNTAIDSATLSADSSIFEICVEWKGANCLSFEKMPLINLPIYDITKNIGTSSV